MEYSRAVISKMSMNEYIAVIPKIYGAHDDKRSVWDVWCHTLHHAAAVAERVRKAASAKDLFKEIADFALWLFTIVHKLGGKFGESRGPGETPQESLIRIQSSCSDLLWQKYPGVCPTCYSRRMRDGRGLHESNENFWACECLLHDPETQDKDSRRQAMSALRRFSEENHGKKPHSIDDWQKMFATIFATNLKQQSLEDTALHLMEEMGEASDAMIRMYSYRQDDFSVGEPNWHQLKLESQIADVFSQLFAILGKINLLRMRGLEYEGWRSEAAPLALEPIGLAEIIWKRYGCEQRRCFRCQSCKCPVCSCPIVLVPSTNSINELRALFLVGDITKSGQG